MVKLIVLLLVFVVAALASTGVDISTLASISALGCLNKQGYTFTIVRCYRSTGSVDPNCATNVANAWGAGMSGVDLYMFPCFKCGNPYDQMSDTLNYTKTNGVKYDTLWLDIEGSQYWGSVSDNVNFFTQLTEAGENLGAKMGVYTSQSQWTPIMGSSTAGSIYPIWYAHYDNTQSFSDFTAFGGWSTPYMKQYNGNINSCGVGIDVNWLPGGPSTATSAGPATTGPATHATTGPATHATSGPATHATSGDATHATSGDATHATSGDATHSTSGPDTTHAASTGKTSGPSGPASTGKTSSPSSTSTGPSSTSGQTTYSSSSTSGSSSELQFADSAIYTKRGGNRVTITQEENELSKKKPTFQLSEVDEVVERDSHFKVIEEKPASKFY